MIFFLSLSPHILYILIMEHSIQFECIDSILFESADKRPFRYLKWSNRFVPSNHCIGFILPMLIRQLETNRSIELRQTTVIWNNVSTICVLYFSRLISSFAFICHQLQMLQYALMQLTCKRFCIYNVNSRNRHIARYILFTFFSSLCI